MHVDERQILSLSQELWTSQLGLSLRPDEAGAPEIETEDRTLASCIKVSGPWRGTILFECSESVVRHAAATFFSSDGESTTDEEIEDALKELAEMIGKKMRPLLPESSKLSRPSVVAEDGDQRPLSDRQGLSDLKLSCEGRPMRIALLGTEEDLAATAS